MVEEYGTEDAEVVVCAYGIVGRVAKDAVRQLRAEGIKAGLIRPITLFPFCTKSFEKLDYGKLKGILVAELSIPAQMIEDVELATKGKVPLESLSGNNSAMMIRGGHHAVRKCFANIICNFFGKQPGHVVSHQIDKIIRRFPASETFISNSNFF